MFIFDLVRLKLHYAYQNFQEDKLIFLLSNCLRCYMYHIYVFKFIYSIDLYSSIPQKMFVQKYKILANLWLIYENLFKKSVRSEELNSARAYLN